MEQSPTGNTPEIKTEGKAGITEAAISSGIGQRMIDKAFADRALSNLKIKEGTVVEECSFSLKVASHHKERIVEIVILCPTESGEKMSQSTLLGSMDGDVIIFDTTFGTAIDPALTAEQKEVVKKAVSELLGN